MCDYQAIIKTPEMAPRVIQSAVSRKTVCRIELPADVAGMEAENEQMLRPIYISDAVLMPGNESIKKAIEAINNAKTVAILAGHGCREARSEILDLSRKLKAPITHTLKATDIFDHDTENTVGLTGLIGNPTGFNAVMKCDLLLMLATDFPYIEYLPHDTNTIQVDTREENIGNRTSVNIGVYSDVNAFVKAILPLVKEKADNQFLSTLNEKFTKWKKSKLEEASPERDNEPLHPQIFTRYINEYAADDAIFTVETGTSAIWAAHHISFHTNRRIMGSFNHGSMAVGLPAAMGASMANPGREVWCISGDGAFNMAMQDFITAVRYNLPVKILILNNSQLSFVKLEMEEVGLAPALDALEQQNVNFADYARLCGGEGIRVEKAIDIENAIKMAKVSTKPFIIDAVVSSGELSLPPHIGIKEAVGFGTSKLKEVRQIISGDAGQWDNLKKELKAFFD